MRVELGVSDLKMHLHNFWIPLAFGLLLWLEWYFFGCQQ